jgi:DNA primase
MTFLTTILQLSMLTQTCIQNIKDVQLSTVVSQYVNGLKKKGANYQAPCPFHAEKTASFVVSDAKGIYKCFGCGASGGVINFVMEHEKLTYFEALTTIAEQNKIALEFEPNFNKEKYQKQKEQLKSNVQILTETITNYRNQLALLADDDAVKIYIANRGWDADIISKWNIGWATANYKHLTTPYINANQYEAAKAAGVIKTNDNGNTYDCFRSRIIIPLYNSRNEPIALSGRYFKVDEKDIADNHPKYINGAETITYNKSKFIFGLNHAIEHIKEKRVVNVVEGYACCIKMHKFDYTNTVATGGTSFTDEQMNFLRTIADEINLFFDNDNAGDKAFEKHAPELLKKGFIVNIANWTKIVDAENQRQKQDVDDYLTEHKTVPPMADYVTHFAMQKVTSAGTSILKKAKAEEATTQLLGTIPNEHIRKNYLEYLCKEFSWSKTQFSKKLLSSPKAAKEETIEGVELLKKELRDKKIPVADDEEGFENLMKFGIYEFKKVYWSKGDKRGDIAITNFVMEILFHVNTGNETAYRIVKLINEYGYECVININTDDMTSIGSFRKILARQTGGFTFKGNDSDLIRLSEWLQKTEKPTKFVGILGYQSKYQFYAFANGIVDCTQINTSNTFWHPVDEYGIVRLNQQDFFIPAMSKVYADKEDLFTNDKKFLFAQKEIDFKQWHSKYKQVYGDKAMPTILFAIACIYRDIIFKKLKRFPMFFFYGQRGSGKGTMIHSLMHLWGMPQDQLMLGGGSTIKATMRKFAQFKNALIWLDEYKNNIGIKPIESLKNLYDGIGYERANTDNSLGTNTTAVNSGAAVSGQEMPTIEPALFMRFILLMFEPGKFSIEQRKAKKELEAMEDGGLACISIEILKHRKHFENQYSSQYDAVEKEIIAETNNPNIDDRMMVNIAVFLTIYKVLQDKIEFNFSYNQVKDFMIENMKAQHLILAGSDDVRKFWEIVEYLFNHKNPMQRIDEGKDFELKEGKIYLRLQNVHPLYVNEMQQRKDANYLLKPTMEHYLSLDKNVFLEKVKHKFSDGSYTHCMVFKYKPLDIDLIKVTDPYLRAKKIEEMGLEKEEEHLGFEKVDDLPFG